MFSLSERKEIKICDRHEKQVPLIWTFAFPGCEYWCPYCGFSGGMLGSGIDVANTDELVAEAKRWKRKARNYLHAMAVTCCSETLFEGKWVKPSLLPEKEKQKLENIRKKWKYEGRED